MSMDDLAFHPVIVVQDRYGGSYSKGRWLAVARADAPMPSQALSRIAWVMDDGPGGDDLSCAIFWTEPPPWIAAAATPDQAVAELYASGGADDGGWTLRYLDDYRRFGEEWGHSQERSVVS